MKRAQSRKRSFCESSADYQHNIAKPQWPAFSIGGGLFFVRPAFPNILWLRKRLNG